MQPVGFCVCAPNRLNRLFPNIAGRREIVPLQRQAPPINPPVRPLAASLWHSQQLCGPSVEPNQPHQNFFFFLFKTGLFSWAPTQSHTHLLLVRTALWQLQVQVNSWPRTGYLLPVAFQPVGLRKEGKRKSGAKIRHGNLSCNFTDTTSDKFSQPMRRTAACCSKPRGQGCRSEVRITGATSARHCRFFGSWMF